MKIEIEVPAARVAELFTAAIEGGDPVTTARKGGWCAGIYYMRKGEEPPEGVTWWYADDPGFYERPGFQVEVHEVADESKFDPERPDAVNEASGALVRHEVGPAGLRAGLAAMAAKFPRRFAQVMSGDVDAAAADAFLQAVVFGEEKYA